MRQSTYRIHVAFSLCLMAVVMALLSARPGFVEAQASTPTPTATPVCGPGYDWTPWGGCRPIVVPCPSGTIDINGNGNNDGGDDCQPLDPIAPPSSCALWPTGPYLTSANYAVCGLPFSMNAQPLAVWGAPGCIDLTRTPYPRALVGLKTTFKINGLFSSVEDVDVGDADWYRIQPGTFWGTEGQYLHEHYGHITVDSLGQLAFDTKALLSGDPHRYPSRNNIRARMVFSLMPLDGVFQWTTTGLSGETISGLSSSPLETQFAFSSYPYGRPYPTANNGPDKTRQNTLPAFQVRLRSSWDLYYIVEWDNYGVDGSNAYVRGTHEQHILPLGRYYSYRAWDRQQARAGVESIYCNAAPNGGYIPVPVIEAQAVVTR